MAKVQAPKGTTSIAREGDVFIPDAEGVVDLPASLALELGFPAIEEAKPAKPAKPAK